MGNESTKKINPLHPEQNKPFEIRSGRTVFVMKTEYSETATETLEQKLKKLILDAAVKAANSYQSVQD